MAASAVVLMHASLLAPHAYLAVDLFFMLSGFVLEHAYGARLADGMGAPTFLWRRIKRLYPLYALGLAISILAVGGALVLGRGAGWTPGSFLTAALTGAIMAPAWPATGAAGAAPLYPLNFPAWTLLAELLANAVFAGVYRRLSAPVLVIWTLAAAAITAALAWSYGALDGGAAWPSLHLGIARVAFAFPAGVLLRRLVRGRLPPVFGALALACAGIALYGSIGGLDVRVYDLAAALILWPTLIALAAASEVRGALRMAAVEAGAASYAAYVTAIPAFAIVHALLHARGLQTDKLTWLQAVLFGAALFAAAVVGRRMAGAGRT